MKQKIESSCLKAHGEVESLWCCPAGSLALGISDATSVNKVWYFILSISAASSVMWERTSQFFRDIQDIPCKSAS